MSDFVNEWVKCNTCFRNFDKTGGVLTSCGHFICNRPECAVEWENEGKSRCPVCQIQCAAISLSQTLPEDILQYFEDPEVVITRALDVYRFQNQQKDLFRKKFDSLSQRIAELEEEIEGLRNENQRLKTSLTQPAKRSIENSGETLVTEIISKQVETKAVRRSHQSGFTIKTLGESPHIPASKRIGAVPVSRLFTPTLARRLQSLTGRNTYAKGK